MNIEASTASETAAVVVFGLDNTGKPHASSFNESDAALATKAAALMGMKLIHVQTTEERALAAKLPKGRVFASGKGFVPFIKAAVYTELVATAPDAAVPQLPIDSSVEVPSADASSEGTDCLPLPAPQPTHWGDIQVGAMVLAAAETDEGWYECLVLSVESDDHLKLRYCDFPLEPLFTAKLSRVALMHPTHIPEPPLPMEPASIAT